MGKLVYAAITSLDGYVNDASGGFDWCAPDEEVHRFVNELERSVGTYLYGRRLYDVMQYWETAETDGPDAEYEYAAIWQDTDKVVYSRTLEAPVTARTRLEREFQPGEVRRLVDEARTDVSIGGAELAGQALTAGIVDEVHLFLAPVLVGGGSRALPDGVRLDVELVDVERFDSGFVHLHHRRRG